VRISGAAVNMPEGVLEVNDGLLREIELRGLDGEAAMVQIRADFPAEFRTEVREGIPCRLLIHLDRAHIAGLLKGKKIVIDPGHGGNDPGGKGPVNLLEKNVVLPVAKNLERVLRRAGAEPALTRDGDASVPRASRYALAGRLGADAFIGIHTFVSKNPAVGGAAVLYPPANAAAAALAGLVQEELVKKLKVGNRGISVQPNLAAVGRVPAVEVEVVTITNWVEEGLLRSPTVHKKAAEGIFNGLVHYFARSGREG